MRLMKTRLQASSINDYFRSINWKLLVFLVLFLDVKLAVKLAAIVIIYFLQPDFKFGFKLGRSRLPLFYLAAIGIATLNWVIYKGFTDANKTVVFLTGILFWVACLLAIQQVKIFTDKTSPAVIYQTLVVFFLINAAVSFAEIARIIWETGSVNPYRYQGNYQKYFISTGDYIKGITFDTSVTNAVLNSFGIIFFLFKRNMLMVLVCMLVLLLTFSNLTNLLLFAVLVFVFLFRSARGQKSVIAVCFFLLVIFLARVSPQNNQYLTEIYNKVINNKNAVASTTKPIPLQLMADSLLTEEDRKEKKALLYLDSLKKTLTANAVTDRPVIPQDNIHSKPFQSRNDTNETRKELISFMQKENLENEAKTNLPGKLIAIQQTVAFLSRNPLKTVMGDGMGNFSSKLALRATALGFAGSFPKRFAYINPDFEKNNLSLYLSFFSAPAKLHSVINSPNSVYVQLSGEYGLLGVLAFLVFYIGFFFKPAFTKGYGLPLLMMMLAFFFTDYWFEQLSVVTIFELLMFLNAKETGL